MFRSLHEADPFGLFSEPPDEEEEEDGDEGKTEDYNQDASAVGDSNGAGAGAGAAEEATSTAAVVLPDNVQHMLGMMKINRLDKVCIAPGVVAS